MSEDKLREEADRGNKARFILENDLYKDAIKAIQDRTIEEFLTCKPEDTASLQRIRLKVDVVEAFKQQFEKRVQTGKLAAQQIEATEAMRSRQRR